MTRFWGKFMLISLAIGVVTGIVQEFQFGMNWSEYSRYVGDIFGAPLAMEGLLAFFLESTFIGLWIFGWDKLSPQVHLATIWLTRVRHDPLGVLHPRRELVDAAPGRLRDQPRHPPRGTEEHLRGADQLDGAAGLPAHDLRGAVHRRVPRARDLRLRTAAQTQHRRVLPLGAQRAAAGARRGRPDGRVRSHAGDADGETAADEDGRGRGALQDHQGREPLDLRRRPVRTLPQAPEHRHPHPAPAVDPRHRLLERRGQGRQPAPAPKTSRNTAPATTCRSSASPTGPSA